MTDETLQQGRAQALAEKLKREAADAAAFADLAARWAETRKAAFDLLPETRSQTGGTLALRIVQHVKQIDMLMEAADQLGEPAES